MTYYNENLRYANQDILYKLETEIANAKAEAYKEVFAKVGEITTEIYNKHVFGSNDLTDEEKDAIINFSDDITSGLEKLLKELVGGDNA